MDRGTKSLFSTFLTALVLPATLVFSTAFADDTGHLDFEVEISLGEGTYVYTLEEDAAGLEINSNEQVEAKAEESCEAETCEVSSCDSTEKQATTSTKKSGGLLSIFFGSSIENKTQQQQDDSHEFPATHEQVALLKVKPDNSGNAAEDTASHVWGVKSFCLDKDDNLLVALGGTEGQLQLLDPEGNLLRSWSLPIVPEALNVDCAGNFLVAGSGTVYKMNSEGEVLFQAESPIVAEMEKNKDQLREQVIEQIKSQAAMMISQRDMYQRMIDETLVNAARNLGRDEQQEFKLLQKRVFNFEKTTQEDLSIEDENAWALRKILLRMLKSKVEEVASESEKQIIEAYTEQLAYIEDYIKQNPAGSEPSEETIESTLKSTISYKSQFASISAAGNDIFIATGAMQGYGFSVWRFDNQLENAEQVVKQLSGCCGQMDVQCCEEGIFVAENSRHRVCHFDREGKKISSWGEGAREGVRGFGGCCNPMNVAFGTDGSVYTAESESGRIKRFTPEGKLLDLVGSVQLVPGCKKVSVAVTKDGNRIYMLDITRNHIIVMEAKQKDQQIASN